MTEACGVVLAMNAAPSSLFAAVSAARMVSLTAPASGDAYAAVLASIAHAKAVAAIFEIMFPPLLNRTWTLRRDESDRNSKSRGNLRHPEKGGTVYLA
jgi:hypothetical protein